MRKLYIFDTTLRDGEQSLGITLNVKEKLAIGRQLVKLGVDIIEAGFPASSPGDFESVKTIAKELKGVTICGLTRAVQKDIDVCAEALKEAERPRIHTGIAVSPVHMAKKLNKTPQEVIETAVRAVKHAKKYVHDVEFYAEDASRSERDFLVDIITKVIDAGATVVNIPDTVGYSTPWQYGDLIAHLVNNVRNIDRAIISIHCHNDLGMATANSLAGIRAGASQLEGTINGIGERAGNTSLEEVIMAIYSQKALYGVDVNINTREIAATSRLVSRITGVAVPNHKAIVGANAFMHASGIHQDGVLKQRDTYEIIDPEVVGFPRSMIVLSARSGRHALKYRLEELGYNNIEDSLDEIYARFLNLADLKGEVFDEDLHALMGNASKEVNGMSIKQLSVTSHGAANAAATITLEVNGELYSDAACGDGPVDALFKAVDRIVGKPVQLEDFALKSVSRGSEAMGDATVKIRYKNSLVVGRGVSTDIFEASALAYVNALSKTRYLD